MGKAYTVSTPIKILTKIEFRRMTKYLRHLADFSEENFKYCSNLTCGFPKITCNLTFGKVVTSYLIPSFQVSSFTLRVISS